jgi:hypothetical protein
VGKEIFFYITTSKHPEATKGNAVRATMIYVLE